MRKDEVIGFFGNQVKTAAALGVTKSAVSQWKDVIPERMAYRVERVTDGRLKVDPSDYEGGIPCSTFYASAPQQSNC